MLQAYDPYLELAAAKINDTVIPEQTIENRPINKKRNKLLHSILIITLGALIAGIVLNEYFKEKQKMINLKREREKEESN